MSTLHSHEFTQSHTRGAVEGKVYNEKTCTYLCASLLMPAQLVCVCVCVFVSDSWGGGWRQLFLAERE